MQGLLNHWFDSISKLIKMIFSFANRIILIFLLWPLGISKGQVIMKPPHCLLLRLTHLKLVTLHTILICLAAAFNLISSVEISATPCYILRKKGLIVVSPALIDGHS